jgi:hypothetical protein
MLAMKGFWGSYAAEPPDKYRRIRITAFSLLLERTGTILERTAERTE